MKRTIATVAVAALLVLAGCSGGPNGPTDDGDTEAGTPGDAETGTLQFYVSDQPNAIDDFEHLNVTVTKVGFHRADGGGESNDTNDADSTDASNGTEAPTDTTASNDANETNTSNDANETGASAWTEVDVDERTVDLTRLKGENATLLSQFELEEGKYTKVFVYVSEVNGTLADGSSAEVKLPSSKLHLSSNFRVEADRSVDFVYDITVRETGNGKYVLKPNAGESGTDVPIKEVNDQGAPEDEQATEPEDDRGNETDASPDNRSDGQGQQSRARPA